MTDERRLGKSILTRRKDNAPLSLVFFTGTEVLFKKRLLYKLSGPVYFVRKLDH